MVRIAVQKLCSSAITTLAPDTNAIPFVLSKSTSDEQNASQGLEQECCLKASTE